MEYLLSDIDDFEDMGAFQPDSSSGMPTMDVSEEELLKQYCISNNSADLHTSLISLHSTQVNQNIRLVNNVSLSTLALIGLLHDKCRNAVDSVVSLAMKYDMVVSSKLKDWKGIDSKICIRLIHLACEWKSDRVRLPGRPLPVLLRGKFKPTLNEEDKLIISCYETLWYHYSSLFLGHAPYIMTMLTKAESSKPIPKKISVSYRNL